MLNVSLTIVFAFCFACLITPYLLYPCTLFFLSRLRKAAKPGQQTPSVSLVISAYNEAAVIREKLENACSLAYPGDQLEIVVISDESDDGTDEIVREFSDRSVRLFRQSPRQGKSAALTQFVPECRGDVLVFSDANSIYDECAVKNLVRHFENPKVGYVVGHQRYHEGDNAASQSENAYWNFEIKLKAWESRLSSVVGGDGAIMAIRRELFTPLKKDDINDFLIPLRIVAAGYRGVFDPEAICYEEAAPSFGGEFKRKVRIVNRSFRALFRAPQAINPFRTGIFAWQLFSHKVVRWMAPIFMLGCLLTSLALALQGWLIFQLLLGAQILFYATAVGRFLPKVGDHKLICLCYYFCLSNVAAGIGMVNILRGRRFSTWTPQREGTSQ